VGGRGGFKLAIELDRLQSFPVTGLCSTVSVPMIYRVKCVSNLFMPMPIGGQLAFSVSNAAGGTWTEQMTCLGLTKPSAGGGREYALIEDVEYGQMSLQLMRSTEGAVYRFDPKTLTENLEFQMGPVGTFWTNYNYEGQLTLRVSVEAIETVVVPAGTFAGCYRFRKQAVGGIQTRIGGMGRAGCGDCEMDGLLVGPCGQPALHVSIAEQAISYTSQPWRFLRLTYCSASGQLGDFMFGPSHSIFLPSPTRRAMQPSRMISVR